MTRRRCATAGKAPARVCAAAFGAWAAAWVVVLGPLALPAHAQEQSRKSIYSCVDAGGKRLTSDRPIPECSAREQRELNADGSVKRIVPPTLTGDEQSIAEARAREEAAARIARQDALRRDRNLLVRFPNEAAHNKAREAALDDIRKSIRITQERLALLANERKPLMDETEFYVGKPLPTKLRTALDANDASTDAQRSLVQTQQAEVVRINALYDAELERLRKLWAGAQPGTLGPIAAGGDAASAPRRK